MDVSIIIASKNSPKALKRHLEAWVPQLVAMESEIIVVDGSMDESAAEVTARFSQATFLRSPPETLVPCLWSDGLLRSQGRHIVICSAHCIPDPDWLAQARFHLENGCDGVAGALDPSPGADASHLAIHYCRYARYMTPFDERATWDLPGDTVAYRREALFPFREAFKDGFWEPAINRVMESKGCRLLLTPSLRATTLPEGPWIETIAARFRHGRQYGLDRRLSGPALAAHLFLWLLLPVVLLLRCMKLLRAKNVRWREIARALPWLFLYFIAWSAGEMTGYLGQAWRRATS